VIGTLTLSISSGSSVTCERSFSAQIKIKFWQVSMGQESWKISRFVEILYIKKYLTNKIYINEMIGTYFWQNWKENNFRVNYKTE